MHNFELDGNAKPNPWEALAKIAHDSVGSFLHEIQPKSELYSQLKGLLAVTTDKMMRSRILCNMERCRWRYYDEPSPF